MRREKATAVFEVLRRSEAGLSDPGAAAAGARARLEDTWIPSRFNVSVDLAESEKVVFNTFTGAVAILDVSVWRELMDPSFAYKLGEEPVPAIVHSLFSNGFLVSRESDELQSLRRHYLESRYKSNLLSVNILATLLCNLRCPYCFEARVQSAGPCKTMSKETELAVSSYLERSMAGRTDVDLCWFGGEPLLARGSMERISAQVRGACKRAGVRYRSTLITNGTLLSKEVIRSFRKCGIGAVQVTVDVPKAAKQDRHGEETLDQVLDNLRLCAVKSDVHLRINLSGDDEREFDELYSGLINRGLHKTIKVIMIAHVFAPESVRPNCSILPVESQRYVQVVAREYEKAVGLGLPVKRFFMQGKSEPCAATRTGSVSIGPDGLLYKCVEDVGMTERAYGSVFLQGYVKPASLNPWMTYDWFQHEMCKSCVVLPQCAGGCAHKRIFQSETLGPSDFCYWNIRGDLEARILDFVRGRKKAGGEEVD